MQTVSLAGQMTEANEVVKVGPVFVGPNNNTHRFGFNGSSPRTQIVRLVH